VADIASEHPVHEIGERVNERGLGAILGDHGCVLFSVITQGQRQCRPLKEDKMTLISVHECQNGIIVQRK
jgi:hypothetical protein